MKETRSKAPAGETLVKDGQTEPLDSTVARRASAEFALETPNPDKDNPRSLYSSATLLLYGQIVTHTSGFFRNMIIVRLLTKADYGIAATFAITVYLVESLGAMGVDSLLVQARDGNDERLQRSAQFVRAMQYLLLTVFLFLVAPLAATVFDQPQLVGLYQILALVPLAGMFQHLDPHRYRREHRFGPNVLTEAGAQVFSLMVVAAISLYVLDYTLVIYGMAARVVGATVISHMTAERKYRWSTDGKNIRRVLSFGWPLLVSGMLIVLAHQGEKFLIGSTQWLVDVANSVTDGAFADATPYSKEDLAEYAIALTLAMLPTAFAAQVAPSVAFPLLSRRQDRPVEFREMYVSFGQVMAVLAAGVVVLFVIGGESLAVAVFSDRYEGIGLLIGVLGISQAIRILRMASITGALSRAMTKIPLAGNVARVVTLLGGIFVAISSRDFLWIAIWACVGELLATLCTIGLFHRKAGLDYRHLLRPSLFVVAWTAAAFAIKELSPLPPSSPWMVAITAVACGLGLISAALCFPTLWEQWRLNRPGRRETN